MILLCSGMLLLAGCASTPPLTEEQYAARRSELESFIRDFRLHLDRGQADSVLAGLSPSNLNWMEDMRYAANSEPRSQLEQRPFFEILSILALRVERRTNPYFDDQPRSMLEKLILPDGPVKKTVLRSPLGPPMFYGRRAEIGLSKAENVPVFFFEETLRGWRFDLVRSLPLILLGAENIARQRRIDPVEQSAYILEQTGKEVLPEDLAR